MKKWIGILMVLGLVGLGFLIWKENTANQEKQAHNIALEKELLPLSVKKRDLQQQIIALDDSAVEEADLQATTVIMFVELDKALYNDAYPIMKDFEYKGVLALSEEQFPGEKGCITKKQFNNLLKAGWDYCVTWNGETEIDEWHENWEKKLKGLKVDMPPVAYFPAGTYSKGLEASLVEMGYTTVIHCGDEELPLVPTQTDAPLWYPGSYAMQGKSPRSHVEDALENYSNIVYRVGFSDNEEQFDKKVFQSMLDWFQTYEEEEALQITNMKEAYDKQLESKAKWKNTKAGIAAQQEEIRKQIAEVEAQMDEVYKKYAK